MSQLKSLLISLPRMERTALALLAEKENEAGRSGLFLLEKCMVKMRFFISNFSTRRRSRGRITQFLAPGGVKRTCAMTGSSENPIRISMVYPPPLNNKASVACMFEDATTIRAAEKRNIFMDFIFSLFFAVDSPGLNVSNASGVREEIRRCKSYRFYARSFSNNSVDLSSSSMASASFLTPRWRTPIISTPRGDKDSSRSKISSPSNSGPNGSRSTCVMR